jgi:hypothetical protein
MFGHIPGPMIIFSVGDGLYLKEVLYAIAMLMNGGVFKWMGLIGFTAGLLFISIKGASSGGKDLDLGGMLVGLVLYAAMFGVTTDVVIEERGPGIGQSVASSYTVVGVPFGPAAIGSIVSRTGVTISERIELAFNLGGTAQFSMIDNGYGKSLSWLASLQRLQHGDVADSSNVMNRVRFNVMQYVRDCSTKAFILEPGRQATALSAADPFNTTTGFGYLSNYDMTTQYTGGGCPSGSGTATTGLCARTCTEAYGEIQAFRNNVATSGDLWKAFAKSVGALTGGGRLPEATTYEDQFQSAVQSLGIGASQAQEMMLSHVLRGVLTKDRDSLMRGLGPEELGGIMVAQGSMQRAWEFAGEESLFRKMLQPLTSFFESTVYAVSPFMALVVGFGSIGLKMLGKFTLLTIWVMMWMPVLAILNHFQHVMASRAIAAVIAPTAAGGASAYAPASLMGIGHIDHAVQDWIATGSLLAASAPMITLMLMYGSAMTATSLANAFKGSDVVNEKIPAPDAVSTGAGMQVAPGHNYSAVQGLERGGAQIPTLHIDSGKKIGSSSGFEAATHEAATWARSSTDRAMQSVISDMSTGVRGSERGAGERKMSAEQVVAASRGAGVDWKNTSEGSVGFVSALAQDQYAGGSLDLAGVAKNLMKRFGKNAATRKEAEDTIAAGEGFLRNGQAKTPEGRRQVEGAILDAKSALKKANEDDSLLNDILGVAGVSAGFKFNSADQVHQQLKKQQAVAQQLSAAMKQDDKVAAAVGATNTQSLEKYADTKVGERGEVASSTEARNARESGERATSAYRTSAERSTGVTLGQQLSFSTVGEAIAGHQGQHADRVDRAVGQAVNLGSEAAFQTAKQTLYNLGMRGEQQLNAAAATAVLFGQVPGLEKPMDPANAQARWEAGTALLNEAGLLMTSTSALAKANPDGNIDTASSVRGFGYENEEGKWEVDGNAPSGETRALNEHEGTGERGPSIPGLRNDIESLGAATADGNVNVLKQGVAADAARVGEAAGSAAEGAGGYNSDGTPGAPSVPAAGNARVEQTYGDAAQPIVKAGGAAVESTAGNADDSVTANLAKNQNLGGAISSMLGTDFTVGGASMRAFAGVPGPGNQHFDENVQLARMGAFGHGPGGLSENLAVVIGGIASVNTSENGFGFSQNFSAEQAARFNDAYANLTPEEHKTLAADQRAWVDGENRPRVQSVTNGSGRAPTLEFFSGTLPDKMPETTHGKPEFTAPVSENVVTQTLFRTANDIYNYSLPDHEPPAEKINKE